MTGGFDPNWRLRQIDYLQMVEENKRNPGYLRRRACAACLTPIVVLLLIVALYLLGFP